MLSCQCFLCFLSFLNVSFCTRLNCLFFLGVGMGVEKSHRVPVERHGQVEEEEPREAYGEELQRLQGDLRRECARPFAQQMP